MLTTTTLLQLIKQNICWSSVNKAEEELSLMKLTLRAAEEKKVTDLID